MRVKMASIKNGWSNLCLFFRIGGRKETELCTNLDRKFDKRDGTYR